MRGKDECIENCVDSAIKGIEEYTTRRVAKHSTTTNPGIRIKMNPRKHNDYNLEMGIKQIE